MVKERRTSKVEKVYEHLKKYGSITSLEAIEKYKATRLSAIIFTLRHSRGLSISTVDMPFTDEYGNKSVYGKYILNMGACLD